MVDILKTLPPFQWRGIKYPLTSRSVSFRQQRVEHPLERRNQELVEQTGARNYVFSYTIPMREELFRGPYSNLFTDGLQTLLSDCRDRVPGELIDPIYGTFRVVPSTYNDETDVQRRDGTDIRIEFVQSPEDDDSDLDDPPTIQAVEKERDNLLADVVEFEESDPELAEALPPVTLDQESQDPRGLFRTARDIIAFPNGVFQQVMGQANFQVTRVLAIAERAKELEQTVQTVATPEAWLTQQTLRRIRDLSNRTVENQGQLKPVKFRTTVGAHSVTSLAAEYGVTVDQLLDSNPRLSSVSTVPSGTNIIIPDGAS